MRTMIVATTENGTPASSSRVQPVCPQVVKSTFADRLQAAAPPPDLWDEREIPILCWIANHEGPGHSG
jgi:hypothetical protein